MREFGDPVLRSPASPVSEFDDRLRAEAERMVELMHDAIGVGLAATQLGNMRRLLTIEASGLEARVIQHEIDHLDGVLMIERTTREQRKGALRALREGTSFSPEREAEPAPAEA